MAVQALIVAIATAVAVATMTFQDGGYFGFRLI
jgi:hypothetical protein